MNIAVAQRSQHLKENSYKAVVHPKLAYCSTISDSRQQKHITSICILGMSAHLTFIYPLK